MQTTTHSATLANGHKFTIVMTATRESDTQQFNADGHEWESKNPNAGRASIKSSAVIVDQAGKTIASTWRGQNFELRHKSEFYAHELSNKFIADRIAAGAVGTINLGETLAGISVSQASYDLIKSAYDACLADLTEVVDTIAKQDEADKAAQIMVDAIDSRANTYKRLAGWCNHCESYCYGDCQAN